MNKSLMTDFYELTMAQTYFDSGKKDEIAYFDIFFRKNPFNGGYTISGGLDETIDFIKNFHFSEEDINYLRSLNTFSEEFLDYLSDLRFRGDIYSVLDGEVVFPNEPVMIVKSDIITAQLLETALLANFNHASLVTTAAKRICNEAGVPVMEFGARRARGIDSAIEASKYAYIGGCSSTSNTYAGKKYNIPIAGTMAHSLVTEVEDEYEAFLNYAKTNPNNSLFLVDTYDTLRSGVVNAIRVANEYLTPNGYKFKGIRIDSGDLAYLSKEARKMLDEAGYNDAMICLSNGLDEYTIADIIKQGACFDTLGVGDNIAASLDRVGGVYKLSAIEDKGEIIPKMKLSNDTIKTTNPGFKKVYRFYDKDTNYALGDVICLYDEIIPNDSYTLVHPIEVWKKKTISNYYVKDLLVPIFINGELVYDKGNVEDDKRYLADGFDTIYPEIKRLVNPHEYYVDLSDKLRELKNSIIDKYSRR